MERLYAAYGDKIEFVIVYIREAHPEMLRRDNETGVSGQPKDMKERLILATSCVTRYKFTMPMVIDGMDGKVNTDYAAWPVRVCITDKDGKAVYYGDRGPAGFRIPEIEQALKKLAANGGSMPPPPKPAWGEPVAGLRLGVSVDPPTVRAGDSVAVNLEFENNGDEQVQLDFDPAQAAVNLSIKNGAGRKLFFRPQRSPRARSDQAATLRIESGRIFQNTLTGEIVAPDGSTPAEGVYSVVYAHGELTSGPFELKLATQRKEGCVDCHGVSDYHHAVTRDCTTCHVGRIGKDDFGVKEEACGQCHPRAGIRGRPQVTGEGGQFAMHSGHLPGPLDNDGCLLCHSRHDHADGKVTLGVPGSGGDKSWAGTLTEFCLACHGPHPPDGVTFPADAKGSGYDKSRFAESSHAGAMKGMGCGHCHDGHGSDHASLLKGRYMIASEPGGQSAADDAELCWTCHSRQIVTEKEDAFDKLHRKHIGKGVACVFCHDVHGGADQGEPGQIDLALGMKLGSGAKFRDGHEGSASFVMVSESRGNCYIDCHKKHRPKDYSRDKKAPATICAPCHDD